MNRDINRDLLVAPPSDDRQAQKDHDHRVGGFADWLTTTGRRFYQPDLDAYRDHLLKERKLAPSTVNVHLSTIRARYRVLLEDGTLRAALEKAMPKDSTAQERESEIGWHLNEIDQAINPAASRVDVTPPDIRHLQLTQEHVQQLLKRPGTDTLVGKRDTAMLALLATTGIRANELCMLNVPDLYYLYEGKPALHVPPGRGCTERVIPYGGLRWGLDYVNTWLEKAKIWEGPVFRGFYKSGKKVRPTRLTPQALDNILASYPIAILGTSVVIRPMDMRRAYARQLYESGLSLVAIAANLGLKNLNGVRDYLGPAVDVTRIPPSRKPSY